MAAVSSSYICLAVIFSGNIHLRVPLADDLILPNAAPQQFLSQHLKDCRLAAAADTGKYLDEWLIDKRLDRRNITPVCLIIVSPPLQLLVYPKECGYATSFYG